MISPDGELRSQGYCQGSSVRRSFHFSKNGRTKPFFRSLLLLQPDRWPPRSSLFRPRSKCGSIPVPSQISSLQKSYLFYHDAHSLARHAAISSPTHLLCVPCGSFPSAARPRESLVYRNAVSVNKKVLRCSYRRTLKSLSYINNVRKSYLTVPVRS